MIGFVILCTAALAAAAAVLSSVVGTALLVGERWMHRLAPAAQSRLLLGAVMAPAVILFAALMGWIADIYVLGCSAHRCTNDHWAAVPGTAGLLLGSAFLIRNGVAVSRVAARLWRSHRTRRGLDAVSTRARAGVNVIPLDEPQAFVAGVFRPQVYVSRGLLAAARGNDLRSVLAHERAHADRRDPLRRMVASLALPYHLPGIAARLERHLARAHEMAADAEAARATGDAHRVAELLVRFARLRRSPLALSAAASWVGGDLEARVLNLLTPGARPNRPRATTLVGCAIAGVLIALAAADPIHSGGEMLLRLLDP